MANSSQPSYLSISPLVHRGMSWDIFKDTQLYLQQSDKMVPVRLTHVAACILLFARSDDPGLTTQVAIDNAATQLFVTQDVYDRLQQKIQQGDKPSPLPPLYGTKVRVRTDAETEFNGVFLNLTTDPRYFHVAGQTEAWQVGRNSNEGGGVFTVQPSQVTIVPTIDGAFTAMPATITVEVVPLDVAVAIAYEVAYAVQRGDVIGSGFREFIADQLRQRAAIHTKYVTLTNPLPGDQRADHHEETQDVHGAG